VIADKAYGSNDLREIIDEARADAVILSKRNRKVHIPHDEAAYRLRNRIERFFKKLKHFRSIATCYDRREIYFPVRRSARRLHDLDALNVDSS
jgi:transposase